jgi:hypothetical protein
VLKVLVLKVLVLKVQVVLVLFPHSLIVQAKSLNHFVLLPT